MTDYSFRTEIIWPDLPEPSAPELLLFAQRMERELFAAMFPPLPPNAPPFVATPCGCGGAVLHRPNCRHMVCTT